MLRVGVFWGLLASLPFIYAVFYQNQILIWDDWVWINLSDTQLRHAAIQLGFWWLADLNVWIYRLPNPNLFLTSVAVSCNFITAVLLADLLRRLCVLTSTQSAILACICLISPFLTVRYTNSVATYNVYLMFFVLGSYFYLLWDHLVSKILAAIFFFASFSLQSLVPAFFLIILFKNLAELEIFLSSLSPAISKIFRRDRVFYTFFSDIYSEILERIINRFFLLIMPFIFIGLKVMSPDITEHVDKNPYASYNMPALQNLLSSPIKAVFQFICDTFSLPFMAFGGSYFISLVGGFVGIFVVLLLTGKYAARRLDLSTPDSSFSALKKIFVLIVLGSSLYWPYVLVGKSPDLQSFTESRHFLPALPISVSVWLIFFWMVADELGKYVMRPTVLKVIFTGLLVAFCFSVSVTGFLKVWLQNKYNEFIIHKISEFETDLKLWVFFENYERPLSREQINYELTGQLVKSNDRFDQFGIGYLEYENWTQPVALLHNEYFKKRYNIQDFILNDSYNSVTVWSKKNVNGHFVLWGLVQDSFGIRDFEVDRYLEVRINQNFGCVDEVMRAYKPNASRTDGVLPSMQSDYCDPYLKLNMCPPKNMFTFTDPLQRAYAIQQYYDFIEKNSEREVVVRYSGVGQEEYKSCE